MIVPSFLTLGLGDNRFWMRMRALEFRFCFRGWATLTQRGSVPDSKR